MARGDLSPRSRRSVEPATIQPTPTSGTPQPSVVDLRFIGPSAAVEAALASHAELYGTLFQVNARQKSRHNAGHVLVRATLIVPVTT